MQPSSRRGSCNISSKSRRIVTSDNSAKTSTCADCMSSSAEPALSNADSLARQQCLALRPLPQAQGSFRLAGAITADQSKLPRAGIVSSLAPGNLAIPNDDIAVGEQLLAPTADAPLNESDAHPRSVPLSGVFGSTDMGYFGIVTRCTNRSAVTNRRHTEMAEDSWPSNTEDASGTSGRLMFDVDMIRERLESESHFEAHIDYRVELVANVRRAVTGPAAPVS